MAKVEIDEGSGFCFGVVNAISKAEEELAKGGTLPPARRQSAAPRSWRTARNLRDGSPKPHRNH